MRIDETTTTYEICSSEIPVNWLISIDSFIEEMNKNTLCNWYEHYNFETIIGEEFSIEIQLNQPITMELEYLENPVTVPEYEYSSIVFMPSTIFFSQGRNTYSSELTLALGATNNGHYGTYSNFTFEGITFPYNNNDGHYGELFVYAEDGFIWSPFEDKTIERIDMDVRIGPEVYPILYVECLPPN